MTQLPLNRTSIRVFLDTMVGNFFKLVVETNGVAMATLVLAVYVVMRVLKHMFVKQRDCDNVTGMPGSHFLVLIVFGACIFATIAGLFSFYGVGIYRAYANKTQARGMIGLAYYRYYIPFFGPLLLVTASFGKRNAKCLRNICATAIGTFAILALYVSRYILPYMGKGVYAQQFIKSGFGKIGIVGTIIFIAIFLAWYMVLCIKKRMSLFFVCFFIVIVVIRLQMVTWPFFDIVGERRSVETYNALHYMEKSAILPKLLYSSSGGFMRIQFMLSRHPIVPAIPDVHENDDYVFISATPTDEGCEVLTDMGFRCYVLSDTECLWIRGESLQAKLKEYAYLVSMENGIVPPEISLLLDTFNTDALYVNGNRRTSFVYAVLYPDKTVPNLTSARLAEAGENALIIYDTPGALRYTDHIAFGSRFLFSQNPAILAYCVAKEGVAISAEREIPLEAMFVDGRHVAGNEALIQPQSILYGPYILLAAGEYEITLRGKGLHLNNARLTGNDGQIRFDSHVKTQQEDLLVLTCRLASLENHFEVVIENTSDADVVVTDIHIEKVVSP
ncbi:hypothetical protein FACS1894204_07690 [Synergistales bacterium]|nr:hypothetical protein FACS1894204_07690 [Synergistales bacterium]